MEKNMESIKAEYDSIPVPEEALFRIKSGINDAKRDSKEEKKIVKFSPLKKTVLAVAAAFAVCIILANSTYTVSSAMGRVPVLGSFFKVITFRDYSNYIGDAEITTKTPHIDQADSFAAGEVNASTNAYIEKIKEEFIEDCKVNGDNYRSLDISYDVITDNDKYFAMDIMGSDIEASGYEFHKYYTIDKSSDSVIGLKDLFKDGENYVKIISDEIIRQMKADKDTPYFIGKENDGFAEISENQNFYINENGELVISFDEYEVGPGSIGAPSFVIPNNLMAN